MRETTESQENEMLKATFREMGLDLAPVWHPTPDDLDLETRQLRQLLRWVYAYRKSPQRDTLKQFGFEFPPVEPCINPDADWERFERWAGGRPTDWAFEKEFGTLPEPEAMTDVEIEKKLLWIKDRLGDRNVMVEFADRVPSRLAYGYLRRDLRENAFEYVDSATCTHLTGCTGYCPGCFQRPWCEIGQEAEWDEDKESGHMALPPDVVAYLARK